MSNWDNTRRKYILWLSQNQLKKNYFFKYDRSASNLLEKILKKL